MKKDQKFNGLSEKEVMESREKNGSNELEKKKKENIFQKALHIFTEPMFLLLIITANIYFILGDVGDGIIMLCFVFFISGIEFFQERKTDKALEALNTLSSLNVKVLRDGKVCTIHSDEVVVGDIVLLEEGDKVCADGIILECQGLGINESTLTGESEIVYKKLKDDSSEHFKRNMCYSGTDVTNGSATIKITAVGMDTEYGKIGNALNHIQKEKTPLEKQIKKVIITCTIISLIFFIVVILINFFYYQNLSLEERVIQSILSGITVAMATIPEEIPVVLTVFLAMGAWSLAKKNTLTRNMKAVETLGAVTVLCTDKTGTLTQNKMTVKEIDSDDKKFAYYAALACPKAPYDPMEVAIQDFCIKQDKNIAKEIEKNTIVHEYVFNNQDKMMGQIWQTKDGKVLCVKGAYESVLPLCQLSEQENEKIKKKIVTYADAGERVLVIAKQTNVEIIPKSLKEAHLSFVGLISLVDPPRYGIKKSIQSCYDAGVRVIMITGDNGDTAQGIATQIGMTETANVLTGEELEMMSEAELCEKVKHTNIFARVYPNHKMKIVTALQQNGEVVAMTGDGVNDATALKKAEIGIAMGQRGTNVAKEAADMILMDDNFNTIVSAIKNGRTIYNNIKKAIAYILVIHIPIAFTALFTPLFKLPALLLPIHVVLLELIIDPTSSIIFQRLKAEENVMKEKPRKITDSIINKKVVIRSVLQGLLIFVTVFGSYNYLLQNHSQIFASTFSFTVLVLSNIFVVYVIQSKKIAIQNLIADLKDKVILLINSVILIVLLLLLYVPIFGQSIGFVALKFSDLFFAVVLSLIATIPFDILKLKRKGNNK